MAVDIIEANDLALHSYCLKLNIPALKIRVAIRIPMLVGIWNGVKFFCFEMRKRHICKV